MQPDEASWINGHQYAKPFKLMSFLLPWYSFVLNLEMEPTRPTNVFTLYSVPLRCGRTAVLGREHVQPLNLDSFGGGGIQAHKKGKVDGPSSAVNLPNFVVQGRGYPRAYLTYILSHTKGTRVKGILENLKKVAPQGLEP